MGAKPLIESSGGEGEVYLSDSEIIHINKPVETTDGNGDGDNSDDSSGGSMGFWPMILCGVALRRRKM